ncbi:MAG: acyltransferase [Aureibaculum sp.]|nr:acyltransferase [Aureibaculum sp.]
MKNYLIGLNSLRGLAALSIVIFHVRGIPKLQIPESMNFVNNYFGLAVPLFFVISSFSLFLSTYHRVGDDSWVKSYFIKRFFRVAPLFYAMIVVYLMFFYVGFNKSYSIEEIILNITFIYNLIPGKHESIVWAGWTIGVEMLFYLIVPYMLITARTLNKSIILCVIFVIISMACRNIYADLDLPKNYSYLSLLGQLGVFGFGVPAYYLYQKYKNHDGSLFIGNALLVVALLFSYILINYNQLIVSAIGYRLYPWALVFSIVILSQTISPFILISNKIFSYAGDLSFSIYLIHPITIYFMKPIYSTIYSSNIGEKNAFIICVFTTFIIVIPIAHIVYKYYEVRFISLGSEYIKNLKKFT